MASYHTNIVVLWLCSRGLPTLCFPFILQGRMILSLQKMCVSVRMCVALGGPVHWATRVA